MWRYFFILSLLVVTESISEDYSYIPHRYLQDQDHARLVQKVDLTKINFRNNFTDGNHFLSNKNTRKLAGPKFPYPFQEVDHIVEDKLLRRDGQRSSTQFNIQSFNSAKIGTFNRLDCNPISWSSCNKLVSNHISNDVPLKIPCGQCYLFDMVGDITLNGLDIEGKLLFPVNHKATIHTPYVIVQGELEIKVDHAKISPENLGTKFILTGTNNVIFDPSEAPNEKACDGLSGKKCNLGVKPFLVAGGKVNINSMSESCATHTPIMKKTYTDPTYNKEDFPYFTSLPELCPSSNQLHFRRF